MIGKSSVIAMSYDAGPYGVPMFYQTKCKTQNKLFISGSVRGFQFYTDTYNYY